MRRTRLSSVSISFRHLSSLILSQCGLVAASGISSGFSSDYKVVSGGCSLNTGGGYGARSRVAVRIFGHNIFVNQMARRDHVAAVLVTSGK